MSGGVHVKYVTLVERMDWSDTLLPALALSCDAVLVSSGTDLPGLQGTAPTEPALL